MLRIEVRNRFIIIFMLILGVCALMAQDITPWQHVRHSAVDDSGRVHVRFNVPPGIIAQYQFYNQQDSVWTETALTNPAPSVYETLLPYTPGQTMNYRLRADYEYMEQNIKALNPGYLSSDIFPPPLQSLVYVGDDPAGDNVFPLNNLDLTGSWFGYSDTKLYCAVSNSSGDFPGYIDPHEYYFYFAGLSNSTSLASVDSCFYGMLYGDEALMVIFPSLYKISNVTQQIEQFWRLGYIQHQVVDGILYMSSNISDLYHDGDFEDWPPANNSMGFMAGTLRLLLDVPPGNPPNFSNGDLSEISQLIFENYAYQPDQNSLPVISDVTSFSNETGFYLQCTYVDEDHDFPLYCKVIMDDMTEIDLVPTVPDFALPVTMTALLPTAGFSGGSIRVSDNNVDFVDVPVNTVNHDEVVPSAPFCKVFPNPFNPAAGNLSVSLSGLKSSNFSASIFNIKGQCVKKLSAIPVNNRSVLNWDGTSDNSGQLADGIYFIKITQEKLTVNKKIVLIR